MTRRNAWLMAMAFSLLDAVAGEAILGTYTPCGDCEIGAGPRPVHITAQLQLVDQCSATTSTHVVVPTNTVERPATITTSGYVCDEDQHTWISSTIDCAATDGSGARSTTVVTDVEQIITVQYTLSTATSTTQTTMTHPTETASFSHASYNFSLVQNVEVYDIVELIYSAKFRDLGPHLLPHGLDNGLCPVDVCGTDSEGFDYQKMQAKNCHNSNCVTYDCTWRYMLPSSAGDEELVIVSEEHETPSPWPPAPAGCEYTCAYYSDWSGTDLVRKSACYTVPVVPGFPPQYPPGACQTCAPPPGWDTTVIILPSPTPVTTTVTVPTTSDTGSAQPTVAPGPDTLSCPQSDGSVYTTPEGSTFLAQCDVGFAGDEVVLDDSDRAVGRRAVGNAEDCAAACEANPACRAASFFNDDRCVGFSAVNNARLPAPGAVSFLLIRRRPETPTITSAMAASTTTSSSPDPSSDPDSDMGEIAEPELVPRKPSRDRPLDSATLEVYRRGGIIMGGNKKNSKK